MGLRLVAPDRYTQLQWHRLPVTDKLSRKPLRSEKMIAMNGADDTLVSEKFPPRTLLSLAKLSHVPKYTGRKAGGLNNLY